jgi:hydroxymethylglutaryl-CoA lyase
MMNLRVFESSARDGIQSLTNRIPTNIKIGLVDRIAKAGIKDIEVASATKLAQMDDGEAVFRGIDRSGPARFWVLVPNPRGFAAAKSWGARHFGLIASASDEFSQKNTNMGIAEAFKERHVPMLREIDGEGMDARVYLSCCFGFKSADDVQEEDVVELAKSFSFLKGKVVICDTTARATPEKVDRLFRKLADENFKEGELSVHFHGSPDLVMDNLDAAASSPLVGTIDTSLRRLGGCPAAMKERGRDLNNAPTQDVVAFLRERGFATDVDIGKLDEAGAFIMPHL